MLFEDAMEDAIIKATELKYLEDQGVSLKGGLVIMSVIPFKIVSDVLSLSTYAAKGSLVFTFTQISFFAPYFIPFIRFYQSLLINSGILRFNII